MQHLQKLAVSRSYLISAPLGRALSAAIAASVGMGRISARKIGSEHRQNRVDRDRRARQLGSTVRTPGGAARWSASILGPILLIAAFTVATAGGADAQTFIGPGPVNSTQFVSGETATVLGNTTITVSNGDGIDAPPYNELGPTLNINTEAVGPSALPGPGSISITTPFGTGVASIFPMSPATINIDSGPNHNVTIMSGGAAIGVSGDVSLTASNAKAVYVDCNAINPKTVERVAALIAPTGCPFVDAGIIGQPPKPGDAGPRIYTSGPAAPRVAALRDYGLDIRVLAGAPSAASALKMSYAGITKGTQAIGAAMMLAATRAGSADDLFAELQSSQKEMFGWLKRQLTMMPPKANRWVAEMQEIAGFAGDDPAARELYEGAAEFYERFAEDFAAGKKDAAALSAFLNKASS